MFKKNKNPKITFEFENVEGGFTISVKTEGKIVNEHIYGLKKFIDEKIKMSEKDGKNRRK